jgi:hypothetical protein
MVAAGSLEDEEEEDHRRKTTTTATTWPAARSAQARRQARERDEPRMGRRHGVMELDAGRIAAIKGINNIHS